MNIHNATTYFDTQSMNDIKTEKNQDEALKQVAQQFESLFMSMMLKSMRDASSSFKSEMTDSNAMELYQDLFDKQISIHMATENGVGLADILVQQLSGHLSK